MSHFGRMAILREITILVKMAILVEMAIMVEMALLVDIAILVEMYGNLWKSMDTHGDLWNFVNAL